MLEKIERTSSESRHVERIWWSRWKFFYFGGVVEKFFFLTSNHWITNDKELNSLKGRIFTVAILSAEINTLRGFGDLHRQHTVHKRLDERLHWWERDCGKKDCEPLCQNMEGSRMAIFLKLTIKWIKRLVRDSAKNINARFKRLICVLTTNNRKRHIVISLTGILPWNETFPWKSSFICNLNCTLHVDEVQ